MAATYASDLVSVASNTGSSRTLSAFSPAAGSNRIVVICVLLQGNVWPSSIAWGSATVANGYIQQAIFTTTNSDYPFLGVWYVKETNFSAGSDIVMTVGYSHTSAVLAFTLTDCDQSTVIGNTAEDLGYGAGTVSASLTAAAGSFTISLVSVSGNPTVTTNTGGLTEIYDQDIGLQVSSAAYSTATGTVSNTPSWDGTPEHGRVALVEFLSSGASAVIPISRAYAQQQ